MPSLGSIIIVFATILQITLASSIIPSHSESINSKGSEFFGAPARNPSSSIQRKRTSLRNRLSKRANNKPAQVCNKQIYGGKNMENKVKDFCKMNKNGIDPRKGSPNLQVYTRKDKLFGDEKDFYQIPAKKFIGQNIMKHLFGR
ncbi:hypothetical protein GcM1_173017 [Golovinomyces cichoracearum]|uniref:Uncharacterized protein n=1 Tax=Golovinomyces cichoracearum TaxID=62708 RepID=A0A420J649_9PEZI|nr:hypothetical protein GcM1_173017 [Golovinomyces cichoracearum]